MSALDDHKRNRRPEFGRPSGRVGEDIVPTGAGGGSEIDPADVLPPLSGSPVPGPGERRIGSMGDPSPSANDSDALPPEADGANPLTLDPANPNRESDEGQPYLDEANPYGRQLENRQNRPIGGIGTKVDPRDTERPHDRTDLPRKR
jgi:hypothetical protein